ncbi:uncharacterized protein B0I36DRAFT_364279 [Microdochium trichocladiopsis]|uniref:Uncharacterized protein n=1 Tax=Microdochium trichocladiopsis TaxID=1682393 RepID=A0A9P8Y7H4_9PEZI|nr:uncharacterized protein B0I36DRAFT_364279 [Microdochium trichocladiopsis]KAH7029803.1 hypothetical protein B0I36DRAFT_364279 [Microdochium trichocladiopsis]
MDKAADIHVENAAASADSNSLESGDAGKGQVGTIRLFQDNDVVLVPTPTEDQLDPLNYAP